MSRIVSSRLAAATVTALAVALAPAPAAALNQSVNSSFETGTVAAGSIPDSWTWAGSDGGATEAFQLATQGTPAGATAAAQDGTRYFYASWSTNSNPPKVVTRTLTSAPFTPDHAANARVTFWYWRSFPQGTTASTGITVTVKTSPGGAVVGTAATVPASSTADAGWTLGAADVALPQGTAVVVEVAVQADLPRNTAARLFLDDVRFQVSPHGLAAANVTASGVDLAWDASSALPGAGPGLASAGSAYRVYRDAVAQGSTSTNYSTQSGLAPNTTYSFSVSDVDAAGNESPRSPAASVLTHTNAPPRPTATATAFDRVRVSWAPPAGGASDYTVHRSVEGGAFAPYASNVGAPPWDDTGVTASTTYSYRIVSLNSAGVEGGVSEASLAVTTPAPPPDPPTSVTATAVAYFQVNVSWTAPASGIPPTSYRVYRSDAPAVALATVLAPATSHADVTAQGGATYTYAVTSVAAGAESAAATSNAVTTPVEPPAAVVNLRSTAVQATRVDLAWDAASGAADYRIERNPNLAGQAQWGEIATSAGTTWADTSVAAQRAYQYRVRAHSSGVYGGYSNTLGVTTPNERPAAVTGLATTDVQPARVSLAWDPAARATDYHVERTSDPAGASGWGEIGATAGTSWADGTAIPGSTYVYRVRAWNDGGYGDYSSNVTAVTPAMPPAAVANLRTTGVQSARVDLAWDAAAGATRHHVERYPDAADGAQWGEIGTSVGTTYADASVLASRPYQYRVRGWNTTAYGGYSNVVAATTPAPSGPSVTPGLVSAKPASCNRVTVRAAYTGDTNGNALVSFARGTSVAGPFTPILSCQNLAGPVSPRTCTELGGVAAGQSYVYQATFADPDNSPQPAPAVGAPVLVPACGPVVSLSDPGAQPGDGTLDAASVNGVVAKLLLTATNGAIEVSGLALENVAPSSERAEPASDVLSFQLWEDRGVQGVFEPASDRMLATSQWDAAAGRYLFRMKLQLDADAAALVFVTVNVAPGAHVGRKLDVSARSDDVTVATPGGSVALGSTVASAGVFTVAPGPIAGSADPTAPMIAIVNPGPGAAVSGGYRVQAQAFDPAGLGSVEVSLSADGWTTSIPLARSARYAVGTNAAIYEATVADPVPGSYRLQARVTNTATTKQVLSVPIVVTVNAARAGDGQLLRRDNAAQLCADCHAIQAHSSQAAANPSTGQSKYGSWSTSCRDCHTPHGATNIFLVKSEITPPPVGGAYQESRKVYFSDKTTGYSTATPSVDPAQISSAGYANQDRSGVCQVCHTRTADGANNPLFRNSGGEDPGHYAGSACGQCHRHVGGFRPSCTTCHGELGRATFSETAPPKDTCGNTAAQPGSTTNRVGAHAAHLAGGAFTDGVECGACHVNPPTRAGHPATSCSPLDSERASLAWGDLARGSVDPWSGAVTPAAYQYATQTCASTYCHGNFRNSGVTGTVAWNATVACGDCHGTPPSPGHTTSSACALCHGDGYAQDAVTGAARATHVDGRLQLRQGLTCTSCHGTARPLATGVETVDDRFRSAPPQDTLGNQAYTAPGVGAHLSHVYEPTTRRPFSCDECHPTPTEAMHSDGPVQLVFGSFASAGGAGVIWAGEPSFTCAATYCHGDNFNANTRGAQPIPSWTVVDGSFAECGDCHKAPPTDFNHTSVAKPSAATACRACHDRTVLADGSIDLDGGNHVNGSVELGGISCHSCHGDAQSDAPPPVADAGNANGAGAHRQHVLGPLSLRMAAFACTQCHPDNTGVYTHADGAPDMEWAESLSTAAAWDDGTSTCSATYCHGGEASQAGWGGTATTPLWTRVDGTYRACGACHASPPPLNASTHHPQNPSCDLCHPAGATTTTLGGAALAEHVDGEKDTTRTGCTLCHGDLSMTGALRADRNAMPGNTAATVDTAGASSSPVFGAHAKHMTGTALSQSRNGAAATCDDCHVLPPDGDLAHATGAGSGGARATLAFSAFVTRSGAYASQYLGSDTATASTQAGQCSSTYCHGGKFVGSPAFEATNMAPSWTEGATATSCGTACHKVYPTSNGHKDLTATSSCDECHTGYDCTQATVSTCQVNLADHIDGEQDVNIPLTCTSCHGTLTPPRPVLTTVGTPDQQFRIDSAPPRDYSEATASNQVGAHQAHVNPDPGQPEGQIFLPIPCRECHTGAVDTYPMQHQDGTRLVDYAGSTWSNQAGFTSSVTPGDGTDAGTPLTCASYCHISSYPANVKGSITTWQWRPDVTVTCGSCHGRPPADPDHTSVAPGSPTTACVPCHGNTVTPEGKIQFTEAGGVWSTLHINGQKNSQNVTCESCHGDAGRAWDATADAYQRAAPPAGTNGSTAATDRRVGTHAEHVYGRLSRPVPCTECHRTDTPSVNSHANGATPITGNFGPLATQGGVTPTFNADLSCSATYCHGAFAGGAGAGATQAWTNTTTLACNACHGMPPLPPQSSNHAPGDTACQGCHEGYTATTVVKATHVDGVLQSNATCKGCHRAQKGAIPRAAVVGGPDLSEGDDFIRASRHVSDGTKTEIVRDVDCVLCHAEGNALTSTDAKPKMDSGLHAGASPTLDLRNLDAPSKCFSDPPDPSCYWCPPNTTCVPPPGSAVAGWKWPGARKGVGAQYTPSSADRDNMDSFCMSCHDADGASGIAVRADNAALDTSASPATTPVARRLTPFNTADALRNYNEFAATNTHTLLKNWRTASYTRVLNVRDQYNSGNLPQADWASHHNLNQFRKRYDAVDAVGWPASTWTPSARTVDGATLNETAGLHCSDCHLNESNAHGSRKTWYLLRNTNSGDKEGDAAFTGMSTTTSTDVCARCHNPGVYAIGASSTASRTKGHGDARCDRWGGAGTAGLGWTGTGTGQLQCLTCHGGETPGGIHGTNTTYLPGNTAPAVKKYRFMGSGGSMRYYSPKAASNVTDADWALGSGNVGCYTITTADAFGNCVNHKGGYGQNAINRSRQLRY